VSIDDLFVVRGAEKRIGVRTSTSSVESSTPYISFDRMRDRIYNAG